MKKCPFCGARIEDNARFCLYCMTTLESKTIITANIKFKKRWQYILAAVLVFLVIVCAAFWPFIKDNSSGSIDISHQTESSTDNAVSGSAPSFFEYGVSPSPSSAPSITSSENTSSKQSSAATGSKPTASKKTNSSSKKTSATTSNTSSASSGSSSSPKPEITDYLMFQEATIGGLFICDSKSDISGEVNIPSKFNGSPVISIGAEAFINRTKITSVTIPSSIKSITDNAFQGCYGLTTVAFSEGLKTIWCGAFFECQNLKTIVLPNSLTDLHSWAFQNCINLTDITIPKGITLIHEETFKGCNNLTNVYYRGTEADKEKITIASGNEALLSATWHYEN